MNRKGSDELVELNEQPKRAESNPTETTGPNHEPVRGEEASAVQEISLIDNMVSYLEAKGEVKMDSKLLRSMAEAWSHSIAINTSPGTLQDVTMDNSYFSYRSPVVNGQQFQGSISPVMQGRSVREYDEQLTALRKENFNLKLRMYFIEETLPNFHNAQTQENNEAVMKELIDTKVELETLRKDLQEKQDLLKDAAQAINQMEQIQKDTEAKSHELIEELKDKIQCIEMEREMEKANARDLYESPQLSPNDDVLHRIQEMEQALHSCQERLHDYESKHAEFAELLKQRDETIKEYEEKVKEMVFQNAELLETLENKDTQIESAERSLRGLRAAIAESNDEKQKLIEIVKDYQNTIKTKMKSLRECESQMRTQQSSLCNVEGALNLRTESAARLLRRLERMEKLFANMLQERKLILKQNVCYKEIIANLQQRNSECYTYKKESIVHHVESSLAAGGGGGVGNGNGAVAGAGAGIGIGGGRCYGHLCQTCLSQSQQSDAIELLDFKSCGDWQNKFELKEQVSFKFCQCSQFIKPEGVVRSGNNQAHAPSVDADECTALIPVRYIISDDDLLEWNTCASTTTSMDSNFSALTVMGASNIRDCFEEVKVLD